MEILECEPKKDKTSAITGLRGKPGTVPDQIRGPRLTSSMRQLSPGEHLHAPAVTAQRFCQPCALLRGTQIFQGDKQQEFGFQKSFHSRTQPSLGTWRRAFWIPESRVGGPGLKYSSSGAGSAQ